MTTIENRLVLCNLVSSANASPQLNKDDEIENPKAQPECSLIQLKSNISSEELQKLCLDLNKKNKEESEIELDDPKYTFFVNGYEITTTLIETLEKVALVDESYSHLENILSEKTINIEYRQEAAFNVRHATRCSHSNQVHDEAIIALQYSCDGSRLATGSGDRIVQIFDANMKTSIKKCSGHSGWLMSLEWSPDGQYLASGCRGSDIFCWSRDGDSIFGDTKQHSSWISSLAWRPLHLEESKKSDNFVSGSKDGTLVAWNIHSRTCSFKLFTNSQKNAVTCVKWSGSDMIIASSKDQCIYMWNFESRQLLSKVKEHGHWINSLSLNSDFIIRTGPFDTKYLLKEPEYLTQHLSVDERYCHSKLRYKEFFDANGEFLVSGSDDRTLCLWNIKNLSQIECRDEESDNILKKSKRNSTAKLKLIKKFTGHQGVIIHVAFSPNGFYFASASFDKSIRIWSAINGSEICILRGHIGNVHRIVWSPDSRFLMSASSDSTVKIWNFLKANKNCSKGKSLKKSSEFKSMLIKDLPEHLDEVYTVDWSPDGSKCASGGKDKLLKIWE